MTRCRVGDLAIVLRSMHGHEGKIVRVLAYYGNATFKSGREAQHCWLCEASYFRGKCLEAKRNGADVLVPDEDLRPIRNPGEDAQDEGRAWLPPVPTQHKETA